MPNTCFILEYHQNVQIAVVIRMWKYSFSTDTIQVGFYISRTHPHAKTKIGTQGEKDWVTHTKNSKHIMFSKQKSKVSTDDLWLPG